MMEKEKNDELYLRIQYLYFRLTGEKEGQGEVRAMVADKNWMREGVWMLLVEVCD